jgi:DNA-binding NtrC family response regulator
MRKTLTQCQRSRDFMQRVRKLSMGDSMLNQAAMSGKAIVYVDDEAVILLALKQELLRHFRGRYAIETALSAEEGEELIRALEAEGTEVRLVISDWLMPGKRGDQFLIDLHKRSPAIRAILVTGQADEAAIERTRREAELYACMRKPWRMPVLLGLVEKSLSGECAGSTCFCDEEPS